MAEWTRVVNTTTEKFLRQVEVNVLRNRKLTALMQSEGRLMFGMSGKSLDWKVRYKQTTMQGYADMDTLTFSRQNRWLTAALDWRGYAASDMMNRREREINKGDEAIVKVWSEIISNLSQDMEDEFGTEMYGDGNAAGRSKNIHGLESCLGDTGTESLAGFVYPPSDTYAGLVTNLGNYGGNWSTAPATTNINWPNGTGDAHYDFWAPVIVKVTSNSWNTPVPKTWGNVCREALRYGLIKGRRNKTKEGNVSMVLMDGERYRLFLEKIEGTERLLGDRNSPLVKLGFGDIVNFEGVDHTWEYGITADTAYGIPTGLLELCCLQSKLFQSTGPDYDIASDAYRFRIDFLGNLRIKSPRGFIKWKD